MSAPLISTPAGFAPAFAIGFADPSARLVQISEARPLPVAIGPSATSADALSGSTGATGLAGPFTPSGPSPIVVSLAGDWSGSVRLQRSVDGGVTLQDLRVVGLEWGVFTQSGTEQVWSESESGAQFWLDITLTSGTCDYRVAQ